MGHPALIVALGDENYRCGALDYPVNIKVFFDSWRYRTLLGTDTDNSAGWTTGTNRAQDENATVSYIEHYIDP